MMYKEKNYKVSSENGILTLESEIEISQLGDIIVFEQTIITIFSLGKEVIEEVNNEIFISDNSCLKEAIKEYYEYHS